MGWVKIDDGFARHPKVVRAGPLGMAMQIAALCYCNQYLTDGFIPQSIVPGLINLEDLSLGVGRKITWELVVNGLITAGLWEEVEGGYRIHDYLDYQPSKEQVLAERKATAERVKQHRAKKAASNSNVRSNNDVTPLQTNYYGVSNNTPDPDPDPNPVPDPKNKGNTPPVSPPGGTGGKESPKTDSGSLTNDEYQEHSTGNDQCPKRHSDGDQCSKKRAEKKIKYAEFVSLTEEEYSSLVARLGSETRAKRCIEILDNYKGASGKRYKSDYRAILNWVITRLEEEEQRKGAQHGQQQKQIPRAFAGLMELAAKEELKYDPQRSH